MKRLKCIIVDDMPLAEAYREKYAENIGELELVTKSSKALEAAVVPNHATIGVKDLHSAMLHS